jgi:phosphatidate cytidylyltransferase
LARFRPGDARRRNRRVPPARTAVRRPCRTHGDWVLIAAREPSSIPAPGQEKRAGWANNAFARVISALVLAPLAIIAVLIGGWPFTLFWTLAAIGVFWEWSSEVVRARRSAVIAGMCVMAVAGLLATANLPGGALVVIAAGAAGLAVLAKENKSWCAGGAIYAGLVLAGPMLLRRDPQFGLLALLYLFAIVWTTDIFAYCAGRLIGGPKLAPAISPKKTWSGAIVGAIGGVIAGGVVAAGASLGNLLAATAIALLLSIVAQAGDLIESAVKRRFGVKDSSRMIPGHGGLMDRLDGFLAAAGVAALLGATRGGLDGAASGLFAW